MIKFVTVTAIPALALITLVGCANHSTATSGSASAGNPPPPQLEEDGDSRTLATLEAMPEETRTAIAAVSTHSPVKEFSLNQAQQLQSISVFGKVSSQMQEAIRASTEDVLVTGFSVDAEGALIGFSYWLPENAGIDDGYDSDVESLTFLPGGAVESWKAANAAIEACQLHVTVNGNIITLQCSGDYHPEEGCSIVITGGGGDPSTVSCDCLPLPGG